MKWYLNAAVILVLSTPAVLYPEIKCYSRVLPDIPTERDSVCIETCNFISWGSLIDSSLSIVGNDIFITYTASDPSVEPHLTVRKNYIGTLSYGTYRLITTGYFLKKVNGTADMITQESRDMQVFEVLPAAANPLRVVGYTFYIGYPFVDDPHPRRSYFYWNGDTLTIGMVFYYGSYASRFFTGIRQSSDTIVIDIVDTTVNQAAMFNGYIAVTSLTPVPQSTRHVRISLSGWGLYNNYSDPNFHQFTADPHSRGIGLSFRKPGEPEFLLCPNDTMYMDFMIPSPFFDTLRILSFQPNPYFKTTGTGRIFIDNIYYNGTLIEEWETYDKDDWRHEIVQESDKLTFDTVSNSANGDHWIRMNYSNENGDPVKGYVYKTLVPELVSSSPIPSVNVIGSVREPDTIISPVLKQAGQTGKIVSPMVRYSKNYISVTFPINRTVSPAEAGKCMITVIDIQGKLIRKFGNNEVAFFKNGITARWDKRDMRSYLVPKGVYIIRMFSAFKTYCSTVIVR